MHLVGFYYKNILKDTCDITEVRASRILPSVCLETIFMMQSKHVAELITLKILELHCLHPAVHM